MIHGAAFRRESACVLQRPDGRACYVRDLISPVLDTGGLVSGFVVVLQDANEDFEREIVLTHRANHDVLTGLANRFEFKQRLTIVFEQAADLGASAGLLAIDLDKFKAVNDSGGHAAGDAMLRRVAEVLRAEVRESDMVARLGGDEFAILLPNCSDTRCLIVGQKILQSLNPLEIERDRAIYAIGASIGLAMRGPHFGAEDEWLAAADGACYRAKTEGRGQLRTAGGPERE